MILGQLTTILSLLCGAWLPTGLGKPGSQGPPPQPRVATNQTLTLGLGAQASLVPSSAFSSWKAFLNLQKNGHMQIGGLQHGQEVAATMTLPLDPQEVAQEMCKAVPFTQVLSQPGCMAMRLRNHLCFGYCSSFFIPGVDPASLVLCNSCVPTRRHWVPVFLWCRVGSPVSRRRVRTSTVLVERCQCSPKA
ncbi:DAN domain family member 5 isoform X3 [Molossus molossus]|uniref:DAN domain family member 5 n=1 Tax=Molossus molossus TaxID=27622 RepID=A0A7J8I5S5_MOLMO|nr:DAN domain family member 5 isoform X3 [Molossus molossus]KAF6479610.1 DAN domain BMP antagonist family member 5 [Molossus molossus]